MKAVRVTIEGRVQGVGFRAWTEYEAMSRGLRGWVRNRRDGSVEAVFAGDEATVDEMVEACRAGPRAARVSRVSVEPIADDGKPGFRTLPTV
jgi:acylphosphatase